MAADDGLNLAQCVADMFPVGSTVDGCVVVEVRRSADEVVLLVRWADDPQDYGIPISLMDTRRDFYYTNFSVDSDEEWLDSVGLGMTVRMGTGFVASARRRDLGEYIELREEEGWPDDRRFYHQDGDHEPHRLAEALARDGLNVEPVLRLLDAGTLLAWVVAYENNSTGMPFVGHAAIARVDAKSARLEHLEVVEDVPLTAELNLAYYCSHNAARRGALTIETSLDEARLDIVGFRTSPDGVRRLNTNFIDADPDTARLLLEADLLRGSAWGQNRDLAGRHIPASRLGRAWHALKFGREGRPPKMRIG
jgi:hypothetical protein